MLDGIPALRLPGDQRTDAVRRFYERAPFPGYPPHDSLEPLRARAERSAFPRLIDRTIPGDARIVEVGCGTGQLCLFLARADRVVVGADSTRASLELGAGAARRFGLDRVQFVETDLQHPGLKAGAFDVVFSSGVLHHTPDPRASFARLAELARPGGTIVLGVYNAFARLPAKLRRLTARLWQHGSSRSIRFCGRDATSLGGGRRGCAINTSIPKSTVTHSPRCRAGLPRMASSTSGRIRARCSATNRRSSSPHAPDNWRLEGWLAQIGWIRTLGREGGLFFTVGRRTGPGSTPVAA